MNTKNNIRFACRCKSCTNKTRSLTQICSFCRRVDEKYGETACSDLNPKVEVSKPIVTVNPTISGSINRKTLAEDLGCCVATSDVDATKRDLKKITVEGFALRCNYGKGEFYSSNGMPFLNLSDKEIVKVPMRCDADKVVKVRITIEEIE